MLRRLRTIQGLSELDVKGDVYLVTEATRRPPLIAAGFRFRCRCCRVRVCRPLVKLSSLSEADQRQALSACRKVTDSIYEGLDVTCETRALQNRSLGETLLLWGGDTLDAFAVCHCGEGTEAGRDTCYIKFAAVGPGPDSGRTFEHLLDACESLAVERGLRRIEAGVNLNRSRAYRQMFVRGFRTDIQGAAMHRPVLPAYNRADVFVVDDWR